MISLKERLKHMVGIRFDYVRHTRRGATVGRGFYVFFGFYWFCFAFFSKWPLVFVDRLASGVIFSYCPNPDMVEGDLMWRKNKKFLRMGHMEDLYHA